jgi:hypothetical protein
MRCGERDGRKREGGKVWRKREGGRDGRKREGRGLESVLG